MLERFLGTSEHRRRAEALYRAAVRQARAPEFYSLMGVPDTVDGRFDMIAVHVFLILHRLKGEEEETETVAQSLFDTMFLDMDRSLREMGAGDLGVGRRVKAMAQAFYGRIAAYEHGLLDQSGTLAEAIQRNVLRDEGTPGGEAAELAEYMRAQVSALESQPLADILQGAVAFAEFGAPDIREPAP